MSKYISQELACYVISVQKEMWIQHEAECLFVITNEKNDDDDDDDRSKL